MDEPKFDTRDGKVRPCSHCEEVIEDAVDFYDDEDQLKFDFYEDQLDD
jgi:predicted PP-loop superfamily ATPase